MSSPPPSPPRRSRWRRMGGALRRASSRLSISQTSRPGTPASESERDSDSVSLKRTVSHEVIPTLAPPLRPAEAQLPSPVAESPAREDDALQQEIIGPSPLAQPPAIEETHPASAGIISTEPAAAPSGVEDQQVKSSKGYIHVPMLDSPSGNPGAFTDEPEALPQPEVVVDPYAIAPGPAENEISPSNRIPGAFSDDLDDLPQPTVIADPYASVLSAPAETGSDSKPLEAPALEPTASYDKSMIEIMKDFEVVIHEEALLDTPKEFTEAMDNTAIDTPAVKSVADPAPEPATALEVAEVATAPISASADAGMVLGTAMDVCLSRQSSVSMLPNENLKIGTKENINTHPLADPVIPRISVSRPDSAAERPQVPTAAQETARGYVTMPPLLDSLEDNPWISKSTHLVSSHPLAASSGEKGNANLESHERPSHLTHLVPAARGHRNVHNTDSLSAPLPHPTSSRTRSHASTSPPPLPGSSRNTNTYSQQGHGPGRGSGNSPKRPRSPDYTSATVAVALGVLSGLAIFLVNSRGGR